MRAHHLRCMNDTEKRYATKVTDVWKTTNHKLAICQRDYSNELLNVVYSNTFIDAFLSGRKCCKFCLNRIRKNPSRIDEAMLEEMDPARLNMFWLGIVRV